MTPRLDRNLHHLMSYPSRLSRRLLALGVAALLILSVSAADAVRSFDVPAGDASTTLRAFAQQAKREIVFQSMTGARTNVVKGEFTVKAALDRLLASTDLVAFEDEKSGAIVISRPSVEAKNVPSRPAEAAAAKEAGTKIKDGVVQLDAFEVFSSKSINTDLPRTRDDVQPYVVFSRDQIEQSNAANLDEFFRTRLPMNNPGANTLTAAQTGYNNSSSINLRGLGTNQTLILIDGRRLPAQASSAGGVGSVQGDINGIPLSMIERVEILPSTASGIYGGGATGGVINIITRKDYSGIEATLSYTNTFDTDASKRRMDLAGSFSLNGGKTFLTLGASYSDGTALLVQDRDIIRRSRELQLAYNAANFYGPTVTPAVGYTTNIRNSVTANLVLKPQYGGAILSSPYTHVPVGYAGPSSDKGAGLVASAGSYNLDLPNTIAGGALVSALPVPLVKSLTLGARHKVGANVEAYVDGAILRNLGRGTVVAFSPASFTLPSNAPNNPFTTAVVVAYPATNLPYGTSQRNDNDRLATGVVLRLPHNWTLGADYSWSRSRQNFAQVSSIVGDPDGTGPRISYSTALSTGVVDVMKDLNVYPLDYTPYLMPQPIRFFDNTTLGHDGTLRAAGPVWELPAGPLNVAMTVEWRQEEQPSVVTELPTTVPSTFTWFPPVSTNQGSAYLEARVPVFSEKRTTLMRALEIQSSVRYDTYRSKVMSRSGGVAVTGPNEVPTTPFPYLIRNFESTSATVGFKYSPTQDVALRASWGSGFLPPSLGQLTNPSVLNNTLTLIDPKRGNVAASTGVITVPVGGNPDLNPEYSRSLSVGAIFTPRFLPGFRISVDYTQIRKRDEISSLNVQQQLYLEDIIPGLVTRAPLTPADQALGYTGGVITAVGGFRSYNIAKREVRAIDIQMEYEKQLGSFGRLHPYMTATYQPRFATQLVPTFPLIDEAGYSASLLWRGNAGLDWKRGRWSAGWNMQYYDSYYRYGASFTAAQAATVVLNQGTAKVPRQFYHDLSVGYDFGYQTEGWRRLLNGTRLTVGVQNFLNTMPPIGAGPGAGQAFPGGLAQGISPYGDARLARYTLTLRKKF